MQKLTDMLASRIPGPFRPYGEGRPFYYESAESKASHLVAQYRARRARGIGASEALAAVLKLAPVYRKGGRYSSPWRPERLLGAPFPEPGRGYAPETLRWTESTAGIGLRFIGWSDELPGGPSHRGWFTSEDNWTGQTLRGGVWQWPGGRLVYGYAEFDGRDRETNPGSAALVLSDVIQADPADVREHDSPTDWSATRDAAQWADRMAERIAEAERDYSAAYHAGRDAAERIERADESRAEALELLAEMKPERKAGNAAARPAICKALRARLDSILAERRKARAKRESAWRDCPGDLESAWRDGYAETAGAKAWNQFIRALPVSRFNGEAGDGTLPVPAA